VVGATAAALSTAWLGAVRRELFCPVSLGDAGAGWVAGECGVAAVIVEHRGVGSAVLGLASGAALDLLTGTVAR